MRNKLSIMPPQPAIFVIVHKRETDAGHIGQALRARGYRLDMRCPRFGDPLPDRLDFYSGVVIFGGPMSVNDPDDYIRREIDWIGKPLLEGKPFLGVCLGGQMLAKHLGAQVRPHESGGAEVGYHPIAPCCESAAADWPRHVYQWHREGFSLPAGARALARGELFELQAFQYGPSAFAVQFHPEMTLAMINRWATLSLDKMQGPAVQSRAEQLQGHLAHGPRKRLWLSRFLDGWLEAGAQADSRRVHAGPRLRTARG